jgi:translation elongation factor EF-1alpha
MSKRDKPHINLIIIGHVDHGKSTSIGHLFYKAGAISEKELKDFEAEPRHSVKAHSSTLGSSTSSRKSVREA